MVWEQWEAELEKRASAEDEVKAEEVPAEEEIKSEEVIAEAPIEEIVEAEKTVIEREAVIKEKVTLEPDKETVESDSEIVTKRDGKEVTKEKVKTETTYTYAEVEEIKAEYEKTIKAKDEEIEFIKENAHKVIEIRAELGEFVEDLSDADLLDDSKLENARLKKRVKELENKDVVKANDESDADLITGHDEQAQEEDETSDMRIGSYLKNRYGK